MGILFKLVSRDFLRRRSMLGFAFLSIVAVCCLVVWFVAGIDMASFSPDTLKQCYGKFDVSLCPETGDDFSPETASKLASALTDLEKEGVISWRAQGRMASADLRHEGDEASLAPTGMGDRRMPYVFAIQAATSPFEMDDGRWFSAPLECVIGGEDAESLLTASAGKKTGKAVKIGDRIRVRRADGSFITLKVVGKLDRASVPERNPAGRGGAGGPGGGGTFAFGFGIGIGGGPMGGGKRQPPPQAQRIQKEPSAAPTADVRRRGGPPVRLEFRLVRADSGDALARIQTAFAAYDQSHEALTLTDYFQRVYQKEHADLADCDLLEEHDNGNTFWYLVSKKAELDARAVKSASAAADPDFEEWRILLSLREKDAERFAEFTAQNTGRQLAVVLNGKLTGAPYIREKIADGQVQITGDFTQDEAEKLAAVLAHGPGMRGQGGRPPRGASPDDQEKRPPAQKSPPGAMFGRRGIGATSPAIYVSLADAEQIFGPGAKINFMFVQLADAVKAKDGLDREEVFYRMLNAKLGVKNIKKMGVRTGDRRPPKAASGEQKQMSAQSVIGQAWATIGIVLVASVFIIFTTLSMGVSEKIRHLAMLRTVGFTRSKVAAYILLEGLALGLLGWIAGLASGWALLTFTLYFQTGVMPTVILTWPCVAFAFGCAVAGALIASIVPAWRATRISPAESMVRKNHNLTPKQLFWAGVVGLILLALIPILVFGLPVGRETKLLIFKTAGVTLMGLGFLLFFPWTIIVTEKLLGPAVARLFGFHPRFLANIFSGNQWRTLGVTIAMSIGLALFTAIHIWAGSMLTMFTVPDTIPDTLVRFQEGVLSPELAEKLAKMPWVREGRFMRLSVAQPKLNPAMAQKLRSSGSMAGNAVLFGVDAEQAYRADDPMLRMKFVEGDREQVFRAFQQKNARVCVIPETLSVNGKLHVGDRLKLAKSEKRAVGNMPGEAPSPVHAEKTEYVEYTVVGVVDFPWVWLSKCAGVRVSEGRTSAVLFVPYEAPLADFGAPEHEFFWFDAVAGTSYQTLSDEVKKLAADSRAARPDANLEKVKSFSGGTLWDSGINRNFVQVSTVESLNNSLNSRAFGVIDAMAKMPLIILILSTVAVVNTMVVSVRARRWEMGVLRACGVTRFGLVRMILAEALLIGLCACVMSFSLGLFYAWIATRLTELAPMFGIIAPHLAIDWARLSFGYILAMGVCLLAGIGPAFSAGMEETSRLLHRKD